MPTLDHITLDSAHTKCILGWRAVCTACPKCQVQLVPHAVWQRSPAVNGQSEWKVRRCVGHRPLELHLAEGRAGPPEGSVLEVMGAGCCSSDSRGKLLQSLGTWHSEGRSGCLNRGSLHTST